MDSAPIIAIWGVGEAESQIALLLNEKGYQVLCIQPEYIPPTITLNAFTDVIHLERRIIGNITVQRPAPDLLDRYNNDYTRAVDAILIDKSIPVLTWLDPWSDYFNRKDKILSILFNESWIKYLSEIPGQRMAIGLDKFYEKKNIFDLLIGDMGDYNHSKSYLSSTLNKEDCRSVQRKCEIKQAGSAGIWELLMRPGKVIKNSDIVGKIDRVDIRSGYSDYILFKALASGTQVEINDKIAWMIPYSKNYSGEILVGYKAIAFEIEKFI